MRLRNLFVVLAAVFLVSCNAASNETNPSWKAEKKYYLRDCIVKVDLNWLSGMTHEDKFEIMEKVTTQVNRAVVSGKLPMFSGHFTRDLAYHIFYFADKCEQKKAMTQKLIDEFFVPNVPGFPSYKIVDKGIEPGFDGAMPSGLWLDQ